MPLADLLNESYAAEFDEAWEQMVTPSQAAIDMIAVSTYGDRS